MYLQESDGKILVKKIKIFLFGAKNYNFKSITLFLLFKQIPSLFMSLISFILCP